MAVTDWIVPNKPGRLRCFRIEIDRPNGGEDRILFHLEQALDGFGSVSAGSFKPLTASAALADERKRTAAIQVMQGLEALAEIEWQDHLAALTAPPPAPEPEA